MDQNQTPSQNELQAAIRRFQSGDRDSGLAACRELVAAAPGDADRGYALALMLLQSGDLVTGVAELDRLIEAGHERPDAFASRGVARLRLGDEEGAAGDLDAALRLNPGLPDAWLALASLHRKAGRLDTCITVLRDADQAIPGHAGIRSNLAGLLAEHGDAGEAVGLLEPVVSAEPDNRAARYNLGTALRRLERFSEAAEHLRQVTERDPDFAPAWHNLGNTLVDMGSVAEGFAAYDHSHLIQRKPGRPAGQDRSLTMTSRTKLEHDIEQLGYLRSTGVLPPQYDETIAVYEATRDALAAPEADTHMVPLPMVTRREIAPFYNRLVHLDPGAALDGPAVSPDFNGAAAEAMYRDNPPGIAWGEDLLTPEALAGLRHFCLASTIWYEFRYDNGYLGAFQEEGFSCPLLLQISEELRHAMPDVLGPHTLRKTWAFKYDSRLSGIRMHADAAAVNVNFWLTPDEANLDPQGGGLVVWDREAPLDWDFAHYNRDTPAVRAFLADAGAKAVTVAHRQNRAVLFNSDLFHETGALTFKPGYENRRINVTMLFGRRGDEQHREHPNLK
ncbi:MAG: tetratricopeptide repeat protein [Alphaproteobacteria bacterium]|nr:tetratricopeptide repeat protein [Rhodospirillaceae bacterium]MBT6203118.1 tetratricopeptide repeat protein [Rhodospirillaceae bacterium]MBT6512182.1 tetratricopeptide repeat protein [Rhodospirillaceae bacterium]MDG2482316.1 tetratricopeptide repeat protein [Alphaproteobacteria bacterium]